MKLYDKYKYSGVEWLGEIPLEWRATKLKHLTDLNQGGVWGEETSEAHEGTVVLRSTEINIDGTWNFDNAPAKRKLSNIEVEGTLLREGDLLITKSSGSQLHIGKTALVDEYVEQLNGCYSNFMQRIRLRDKSYSKLLFYFLNSSIAREQYNFQSRSSIGLQNLNAAIIDNLVLALPSDVEVKQIIDYLDVKNNGINQVIRQKELLLEKLQAKRQAIISEAITRGLNARASLKRSSTVFLDCLPASWLEIKFKYLVRNGSLEIQDGNHGELHPTADDYVDSGIPFIMANNVRITGVDMLTCKFLPKEITDKLRIGFSKKGDVLLTHKGTIGRTAIVEDMESDYIMLTPQVTYYRVKNENIFNKFLYYFFQSTFFQEQMKLESSGGSTRSFIGITEQKELIFLMPLISEQKEIANYLDLKLLNYNLLENKITSQIDKLMLYRQSLISEVVTGKIKVV